MTNVHRLSAINNRLQRGYDTLSSILKTRTKHESFEWTTITSSLKTIYELVRSDLTKNSSEARLSKYADYIRATTNEIESMELVIMRCMNKKGFKPMVILALLKNMPIYIESLKLSPVQVRDELNVLSSRLLPHL